jgi:hypothetical protein
MISKCSVLIIRRGVKGLKLWALRDISGKLKRRQKNSKPATWFLTEYRKQQQGNFWKFILISIVGNRGNIYCMDT